MLPVTIISYYFAGKKGEKRKKEVENQHFDNQMRRRRRLSTWIETDKGKRIDK